MRIKNILSLFLIMIMGSFVLSACGDNDASEDGETNGSDEQDGKIQAVSTFSILTDIVENIGGDEVDVHNVVPRGNDPHEYDPTPEDAKKAADADAVFYNGMKLEGGEDGWAQKMMNSANVDDDIRFSASEGVEPHYFGDEGDEDKVNPHDFVDPGVGIKMTKNIRDALIEVDPDHEDEYKANAEDYLDELDDIDQEYKEKVADIPEEDRVFMASERAYQYMVDHYGLKEGWIYEVDTQDIGTPEQIKAAVNFVEEEEPPALFVEGNVNKDPMESVSDETGVEIAHTIYSDDLADEGEEAGTYLGLLRSNIEYIHDGLTD